MSYSPDTDDRLDGSSVARLTRLAFFFLITLTCLPQVVGAAAIVTPRNPFASLDRVRIKIGGVEQRLPYEVIDGWVIVGGDMIVGREEDMQRAGPRQGQHDLVSSDVFGWPGAVIPYVLTEDYLATHSRDKWNRAVNEIHKKTNLRLVERTTQGTYVEVTSNRVGGGCHSQLGRSTDGAHALNLGQGCGSKMTHIHEILHTFGLPHEHQRHDRDSYIIVHEENIEDGKSGNFTKLIAHDWLNPYGYDYESIMHYGPRAFSKNGQATLEVRTPPAAPGQRIGQRSGLSRGDLRLIEFRVQLQAVMDGDADSVSVAIPAAAEPPALSPTSLFGVY